MGIVDWLRSIVGLPPKGVKRRTARLDPTSSGSGLDDLGVEVVDMSGGPLREHHRRLAVRDRRLLPKKKEVTRIFTGRKKVMSADEANRLFAGTLRTRNRTIRDLLPDEKQLARLGLPGWRTEADLAAALGVSLRELHYYAIHRPASKVSHYVTFSIPKRSGGRRLIMAPKRKLRAMQRTLDEQLVRRLPVSPHAHGFVKTRSILTGATPHVGKRVVVRMDLRDFFPTVTFRRVRGMLVAFGYGYPVATTLAVLMTEAERQPVAIGETVYQVPVGERHCVQGAPTSPGLCNAIALRLDRRLSGLARRLGFDYTRYADDLTFSGHDAGAVKGLLALGERIIRAEGFVVNESKTRVQRRGQRQSVTGVTVNDVAGLSRRERRRIRAALHQASRKPVKPARRAELEGHVAYASMLNGRQAAPLRAALENVRVIESASALPAVSAGETRRFEFIGGNSMKYWEITVSGTTHTVHFGRIGTAGQSKTKSFASREAALEDAAKLIREKTGKGYEERE